MLKSLKKENEQIRYLKFTSTTSLRRKTEENIYVKIKKQTDLSNSNSSKSSIEAINNRNSQSLTNSDTNNKATSSVFLSSSLEQSSSEKSFTNINKNQKILEIIQNFGNILQSSNDICNLFVPEKKCSEYVIDINSQYIMKKDENIETEMKIMKLNKLVADSQKLNKDTEKLCNDVIQSKRNQKTICIDDIITTGSESKSNNEFIALESEHRLKKYDTLFNISSQNIQEVIELMKFVTKKEEELANKDHNENIHIKKIEHQPRTVVSPRSINNNKNLVIQMKNIIIPNIKLTTNESDKEKKETEFDDSFLDAETSICEHAKTIKIPESMIKNVHKNREIITTNINKEKIIQTVITEPSENMPQTKIKGDIDDIDFD